MLLKLIKLCETNGGTCRYMNFRRFRMLTKPDGLSSTSTKEQILPTLKPNVTFVDETYLKNTKDSVVYCPAHIMSSYFADLQGHHGEAPGVKTHQRLVDAVRPFLSTLATAVFQLGSRGLLRLEFCSGDMHQAARLLQQDKEASEQEAGRVSDQGRRPETTARALATATARHTFKRIYLSNVPDYTGLLNAFVHFLPLLDATTEGALLLHNILFNPATFQALDDLVYSSLRIPRASMVGDLLGADYVSGGLWSGQVAWELRRTGTGMGTDAIEVLIHSFVPPPPPHTHTPPPTPPQHTHARCFFFLGGGGGG